MKEAMEVMMEHKGNKRDQEAMMGHKGEGGYAIFLSISILR